MSIFESYPTFLSSMNLAPLVPTDASVIYTVPSSACVSSSDQVRIYRLPYTPHSHWSHYKIALYGREGHLQRVPSVKCGWSTSNEWHVQMDVQCQPHPKEWYSLPRVCTVPLFLSIELPPSVDSEHCHVFLQLRGLEKRQG